MKKAMQIFAIVVIAMYFIFVGVLVYEVIQMWDDHECWMIKASGETDKKCEEKYGLR